MTCSKKDIEFKWNKPEMDAFYVLKSKLASAPVLSIYSPHDATELHCDASTLGFGAVLMQRKSDSKYHPIFYFSKRTIEVENRYHSFELETLAIINALKRFRSFLLGINFKIITDCNSLKLTLDKKDLNPRIARWALELQDYDYVVEHRSGNRMKHVDALSRVTNISIVEDNPLEVSLSVSQGQDPKIKELIVKLEAQEDSNFEMRNGLVCKKIEDNLLFYVPAHMENNVIYRYHDGMGHLSLEKTQNTIKQNYWFPKTKEKIQCHIKNCLKCISFSPNAGRVEVRLHPIPKGNLPFQTLHIDHYGPVDKKRLVKQHIFLVVDVLRPEGTFRKSPREVGMIRRVLARF